MSSTTAVRQSDEPSGAAKNAAIAVPIIFIGSLAIALVAFFWWIRQQRRREDIERGEGQYKDVTPSAMKQRKDHYSGVERPEQTHQPDTPHTPLVKQSSNNSKLAPHTFLHSSSRRGTSSSAGGPGKLVMPGRMNSEPFARDQGPLVKDAIRDSGLISPGTVAMGEYFPASRQADNMSIPDERSEEGSVDAELEKSGAFSRVSYVDSERSVEYGAGYPTTVAQVERPSVISTRNLSTNPTGAHHYQSHGAKNMRTL